ncbi:rubredoxin [Arenibacter sp. GZD-96]
MQIAPGTPFDAVPETFVCPVCEAPKTAFSKIVMVLQ